MKKTSAPRFLAYPRRTLSIVGLGCAVLAACGGGGSDPGTNSNSSSGTAVSAATPVAAPASSAAPATSNGSTCNIANFAATALARINAIRAAGADCHSKGSFAPAAALAWNPLLTQSAEGLSQDMVANNFFAHTGSNGSTLASRVDATGFAWSSLGENIAAGYDGIDAVMAGWLASDGHCANLMNPNFDQVGLVCVPGSSADTYRNYWTMDLGQGR